MLNEIINFDQKSSTLRYKNSLALQPLISDR